MLKAFVTGGSGFLGSRLIPSLAAAGASVTVLDRSGTLQQNAARLPGVEIVRGDLLQPESYRAALARADVAVHLAAQTGRASESEHFRVNAQGTAMLVDTCRRAGVGRILFVSSIATKFPDDAWYHYAKAKILAEKAVSASGLRFAIVRPTIILGQGSPILGTLAKLAQLPLIPVFGDGKAQVQPIYVDDLVDFILMILQTDAFCGDTYELGGPTSLSIEELLQEIRQARQGARGHAVHLPLALLLPALRTAERLGLGRMLPVSAGQLSSFRYNGTIENNPLFETRRATLHDIRGMLALSFAA